MTDWGDDPLAEDADETTYAQGRLPSRTYASRSFELTRPGSADHGQPARFVCKVFDPDSETVITRDVEEWTICETPAGRYQFKLLVAREPGNVKEIWIQRVPAPGSNTPVRNLLNLQQPEVGRLLELLQTLPSITVEGGTTVRVDDSLVRDLFANPDALVAVYRRDPSHFRRLIADDTAANDVIAVAARRSQVERFRRLIENDDFFDAEVAKTTHRRAEDVWQAFFEANPWIFGVTLAPQLLTSWDESKLEQAVVGHSVTTVGKRSDALMQTAGRIRSMVFAEIKTHRTPLLGREYRSGCWNASDELAGGIAQVHGTVHRATLLIGERLGEQAPDGSEIPNEHTYLLRPRSFLVIGQLEELIGDAGGDHVDKVRSFELLRRHLQEPEVVTFDELLARAEWIVDTAAAEDDDEDDSPW